MKAPNPVLPTSEFPQPAGGEFYCSRVPSTSSFRDLLVSDLAEPPTTTLTCGCGDGSLVNWCLEGPPTRSLRSIRGFEARCQPTGAHLLATWARRYRSALCADHMAFGPVATLNVAVTLSPALSSLAMFILLRRWVSWTPAAFFGGLLTGFHPSFITNLTDAHFFLGMAVVPPLVVACLDELLIRQRSRPIVTGIVLGLLVTLQFFVSTEVLLVTAIMGVVGLVLVLGYASWKHFDLVRQHTRYAVVGLTSGAVTAGVLLAYPAWFALAGPAHCLEVWANVDLKAGGSSLNHLFVQSHRRPFERAWASRHYISHATGGYQGGVLVPSILRI